MKITFEQQALTASGKRDYTVEIFETVPQAFECCADKEQYDRLCKAGCPNYNKKWSCPPHAPAFCDFVTGWEKLFVFYLHTDLKQYAHLKNDHLKIRASNTILKSRADKFLRKMAVQYGAYISTGSCRLCQSCKGKKGLPCVYPDKMTYSFEAMGLHVGDLVDKCFDKPLVWKKKGDLPEYTSVVCGLLTNETLTVDDLHDAYLQHITG